MRWFVFRVAVDSQRTLTPSIGVDGLLFVGRLIFHVVDTQDHSFLVLTANHGFAEMLLSLGERFGIAGAYWGLGGLVLND